ncbi:arylsulfotransferase family protein [Methylomonas methanica]|uniref:Cyclic nucleotide-binding domain-containing protein n=1 Tax=Methylomonas methanica (strain DSM 25384 / MC09) TaxID=857087 RepID=F9ZW62_METMM|nr:arylsulfotransferase family protein [Methylomonas methanica]AEG02033.1 hypothetical protein Metme_3672 [Methylomonas methanica MC09]
MPIRVPKRRATPRVIAAILLAIPMAIAVLSSLSGQAADKFIFFSSLGVTRTHCIALSGAALATLTFSKWIRRNISFIYFVTSLTLVAMIYGFAIGRYKIYPFQLFNAGDQQVAEVRIAVKDWIYNWQDNLKLRPSRQLRPATRPGSGVIVHNRQQMLAGPTLISGFWNDSVGVKLIDEDGAILHEWHVAYRKFRHIIKDDTDDFNVLVHGAILLPDGDIVFNYENHAMIRMDWCSEVSWILPEPAHHSLFQDEKQHFWVPVRKIHDENTKHYPLLDGAYYEDFLAEISPEGKILRQFSIIDAMYKGGFEAALFNGRGRIMVDNWQMQQHMPDKNAGDDFDISNGEVVADITHLNSVTILSEENASHFPMFKAGDILVSLRNLSMIAVIRPETGQVVWTQIGPFLRQHDAHFLDDGTILLYDNRPDWSNGQELGGSRIAVIDPLTRQLSIIYQGNTSDPFYARIGGKVQQLENKNLLISDFESGRAFEVTPAGETVWEFINRYDKTHIARITQATRYPSQFAGLSEKTCAGRR